MTMHMIQGALQYPFNRLHKNPTALFFPFFFFTVSLCSAFQCLPAIQRQTRAQTRCLKINESIEQGELVKLRLISLVVCHQLKFSINHNF